MSIMNRARAFFLRHKTVFTLGLSALTISSLASMLAGITLGYMTGTLQLIPGLLVLIPPAIGMRGNIFGAVGSRLGTSLHIGTFELALSKGSVLRENLESSLILTMITSFIMGILAKFISEIMGLSSVGVSSFIFISVIGGVLAGLVLVFINILIGFVGFRKNWDIDNISAPLITAAGDIVTLPMLFMVALIILELPSGIVDPLLDVSSVILLVMVIILGIHSLRMREGETRRVIIESSPVLVFCILLDIGAGVIVDHQIVHLATFPALLVLIPPFLEEANALGGILTSRISSMLHMGLIKSKGRPDKLAMENFAIMYLFSIWVFLIVGVSTHLVSVPLGFSSPGIIEMIILSLGAGVLTVTFLNVFAYYVAINTFRFNLNPDSLSIPLTSSTTDLVGAGFLVGMMLILGLV